MAHESLGNGKGGKNEEQRALANEVRSLTMRECRKHLKKGKGKLYEAVLLRLAGSVLPRLNEVSGPNGKTIPIWNVQDNNSGKEDTEVKA